MMQTAIERDGFVIVPGVLSDSQTIKLTTVLTDSREDSTAAQRRGGRRNLLDIPAIQQLCRCRTLRELVELILGPEAFATRGVLFDKTPNANWKVTWHQDRMIALRERRETPGFSAWSVKAGVPHAQPPAKILESMISVRLHLDDCYAENGPLRVLPGSHAEGILDDESYERWKRNGTVQDCFVPRGGVLLMRPLLLHASSAAIAPGHRRVVHLDFAAHDLPDELEWHRRV